MVCLYSDFTSIQSVRLALTVVDEENGVCMCGKIWQRYGNLGGPVGLRNEAIGFSCPVHGGKRYRRVVEVVLEEAVTAIRL